MHSSNVGRPVGRPAELSDNEWSCLRSQVRSRSLGQVMIFREPDGATRTSIRRLPANRVRLPRKCRRRAALGRLPGKSCGSGAPRLQLGCAGNHRSGDSHGLARSRPQGPPSPPCEDRAHLSIRSRNSRTNTAGTTVGGCRIAPCRIPRRDVAVAGAPSTPRGRIGTGKSFSQGSPLALRQGPWAQNRGWKGISRSPREPVVWGRRVRQCRSDQQARCGEGLLGTA